MPKIELVQGDCLEKMKDIPGGSIDCVITDPPYGITGVRWDTCIPFEPMWEQLKRITKKTGAIVLFGSQPFTSALVMSNVESFAYEWIWAKSRISGFLNARKMPLRQHEQILVFCDNKCTGTYNAQDLMLKGTFLKPRSKSSDHHGFNPNRQAHYLQEYTNWPSDVLFVKSPRRDRLNYKLHPTQKPVALMEYLVETYTNEGETVLDFTMGSGTTGVACKNLNRDFIGIEIDPGYLKIAEKRINDADAKEEGKTFQDYL